MTLNYSALLEFIFPVSDDEKLLHQIRPEDFANLYEVTYHHNFIALSSFRKPAVRAAVHLTKYHHHQKAIKLLAELLRIYLSANRLDNLVVIPIPLSAKREHKRGYNQVTEVIKEASKTLDLTYHPNTLKRTRHTAPQTSLDKAARLKNVSGAFAVTGPTKAQVLLSNKDVILLDDVVTTGATLGAAKAALLPHSPASVTCIALAH